MKRPGNFATGTREPLSGVRHANDYFAVDLIDVDFRDLPRGREAKNPLVELGAVHARKLPSEFPKKTTCSTHFAGDPKKSAKEIENLKLSLKRHNGCIFKIDLEEFVIRGNSLQNERIQMIYSEIQKRYII